MAGFGRIGRRNLTNLSPSFLLPPALLISCRGIASKLFVGGKKESTKAFVKNARVQNCAGKLTDRTMSGLSFYTTEKGLSEHFSQYGQVVEAKIVMDRVSDRSKGFGFVTFASEEAAQKARTEMDGKELNGRTIFVDYAKPKAGFGGGMPIARGPPDATAGVD